MKIYKKTSIEDPNDALKQESLKFDNPKDFSNAYSVKKNLLDSDIPINSDGTVTLYHATHPNIASKIEESGVMRGGSTATGGMTGLALEPSAFLGWNRDWVQGTWGKGGRGLVEIKVPYYYIRQPSQNQEEVYFEGGLKRVDDANNIWKPIIKPRDTFYNKIPSTDYDFLHEDKTLEDIWEEAHKSSGINSKSSNKHYPHSSLGAFPNIKEVNIFS